MDASSSCSLDIADSEWIISLVCGFDADQCIPKTFSCKLSTSDDIMFLFSFTEYILIVSNCFSSLLSTWFCWTGPRPHFYLILLRPCWYNSIGKCLLIWVSDHLTKAQLLINRLHTAGVRDIQICFMAKPFGERSCGLRRRVNGPRLLPLMWESEIVAGVSVRSLTSMFC